MSDENDDVIDLNEDKGPPSGWPEPRADYQGQVISEDDLPEAARRSLEALNATNPGNSGKNVVDELHEILQAARVLVASQGPVIDGLVNQLKMQNTALHQLQKKVAYLERQLSEVTSRVMPIGPLPDEFTDEHVDIDIEDLREVDDLWSRGLSGKDQ